MISLSSDQHRFFQQLAEIAFTNPFSRECEVKECKLIGIPTGKMEPKSRDTEIQKMSRIWFKQLEPFDIRQFSEQKREMMKISWLFNTYHDLQDDFDKFIETQANDEDASMELPFAGQLITRFECAGFNRDETTKYIALFYQLRRGFNFISQAISGDCPSIVDLRMRLWNNIFTFDPNWYLQYLCGNMEDFSTLLLGETGTGKSLVSHAIGCSGYIPFDMKKRCFRESFTHSFQAINLAQYPASLLESELFGHKKGAFTGAVENHQGIFARCSVHGAVFIDEIGDIDIPTQVKLLNVIQDRIFSPVGSHEKHRFEGRVIAATNRNIQQLRNEGQFRNDLYYRLCSDVIVIPSLQQRLKESPDELHMLIERLLARMLSESDIQLVNRIESRIRSAIPKDYHWPGNVRELEQCIRRICLTGSYLIENQKTQIEEKHFMQRMDAGNVSAQQLLQAYCRHLYEINGSYEAVARIANLDRRTARKYIIEEKTDDSRLHR